MSVHHFWTAFALEPFLNALLIGLSLASIWLVAALGLAIIYGTMGVINMAQGEFIMLGAYAAYVLQKYLGFPYLLTLPGAFVAVAAIGWVLERLLIRHLYHRPLDTMLATWGVSLVLVQGVRILFGADPKYIGAAQTGQAATGTGGLSNWMSATMDLWFFHLSWFRIFIVAVSGGLFALTWWLMYRTSWGLRIRAVTQNKEIAAAHGVDAERVYGVAFAYGAGLAGVAGALFGVIKNVFPNMGSDYIVEAFLVVVVGGVGQLFGSLASALSLGEINAVLSYFTNGTFARFVLFILIVVFLRFRPSGLFAEQLARR